MSENGGFEIPIGGDLSSLNEAFAAVIAAVDKMGANIAAAMERSNAAMIKAQSAMNGMAGAAHGATAAQSEASTSTGSLVSRLGNLATRAGAVGHTLGGISEGLKTVNTWSRMLTGVNVAAKLSGWINSAGGVRAAFAKIPAAMSAIASNPTFRRLAIGAAAAVAGIVAIRVAWRTAAGSASLLGRSAATVFRGMVSGAKAAASAIAGTFRGVSSAPGKLLGGIPGLPLAGIVSAAGAVALLTSQISKASDSAAVFEDMSVSIEHFMGSAKAAKTLLDDLGDFGNRTPFETIDVQQTAEGLLGAGVRDDVAGITKDLAAMAKNGQELREIGDALGKGFAKGKFQTEEMNKFLERGINLNPALQQTLGLTGKAFQQAVEDGLSFDQVTKSIRAMSREGGQFFGLLEKRSRTFTGLTSTLASGWMDIRKAFGTPLNDALKPILEARIASMGAMLEKAKELGEKVGNAISIAFEAVKSGRVMEVLKAGLDVAFLGAGDILLRGFKSAVAFLATVLPPIFDGLMSKLKDARLWEGIGLILQGAAMSFAAEIRDAMGQTDLAESLRGAGSSTQALGGKLISKAGNVDMGAIVTQALLEAAEAAKKAAGGPKSDKLTDAEDNLRKIIASLQSAVDAEKIFGKLANTPTGKAVAPAPANLMDTVNKAVAPAVMSLSRIGGGGAGNNPVFGVLASEAKKQSGFQKTMVELLKSKPNQRAKFSA